MKKEGMNSKPLTQRLTQKRKTIVYASCMVVLVACCFTFFGLGIWFLSPLSEPKVTEVRGTVTKVTFSTITAKYSSSYVNIVVDGVAYSARDGAFRALDKDEIRKVKVGDSAILSYEAIWPGGKEIRILEINGVSYLTMGDYIKGEQAYLSAYGIMLLVFGAVTVALAVFLIWILISHARCKARDKIEG
ncbi:MAG: hypothetical protein FWD58_05970 [Firmicutes bacterium]|nr:hypothetical protein [Bacillota bacterium]